MLIRNNNKKAKLFPTYLNTLLTYNLQNLFPKTLISKINQNFTATQNPNSFKKTNFEFIFEMINQNLFINNNKKTTIINNSLQNHNNNVINNLNLLKKSQIINYNFRINKLQKSNFSSYNNNNNSNTSKSYSSKSNYDFTKINKKLNSEVLHQIFEKCDLEPKSEGNHLRLKECPLCDKPHNYDKTNMHTCCINTDNMLFNCFRCGSKGHVIRIIKLLRKKFNLDIINEILDTGNFSSTEGEDSGKRIKGDNDNNNDSYYKSRIGNNASKNSNVNNNNGYSDFSDLEFYKVNKSKKVNSNGVEKNAVSDNDLFSDSSDAIREDGNKSIRSAPVFSPLLKKSENNSTNKSSVNNTKNPFSVSFSINKNNDNSISNVNNNTDKENDKVNINVTTNSKNSEYSKATAEMKTLKFLSSNPNTNNNYNSYDNNKNNNYVSSSTAADNKPKFSINPISSISGANLNSSLGKNNTSFKISISNINLINETYKRINFLQEEKLLIVKDYLINERKLSEEVLKFYKIGASFEKFKNTDFDFITLPTVTFPMFYPTDNASYLAVDKSNLRDEVYECLNCDKFFLSRTKVRAIGKEFKHFMRIEPPGAVIWGLFGLDTVPEDAKEIVITEGEYDAMSVYQSTGMPTVSLPNGATNLPTQMLSFFSRFKRIYLWMDADQAGKISSENFAKKLGETRTLVVNTRKYDPEGPKDANDAMRLGKSLKQYLDEAKPLSGDNIVTVTDLKSEVIQFLTSYDQYSGYKSISFDFFNQKLKGLRMGEFSILTGETGSGKTTFLTQLSLDFLQQRVPTLWGSFEIKNDKLISLFLMQLARKNLRQAPVKEIEYYAETLEKFPLYLLKFHGAQSIDEIMNTMNYAVYNFDIQNIVLDNLQFMVGAPTASKQLNKFDYQDEIIQKMRKFATEKNIHLTLVIHPKKTDEALKISSIFGTAKASQEADNIYIIQAYKGIRIIEIAKNRFDGATGKVALAFDPEACRYFELEESEFTDYTKGHRSVQDIIAERVKMHGKVEYKHKEYAGVNYDKIVEFNKNYLEKLSEMKKHLGAESLYVNNNRNNSAVNSNESLGSGNQDGFILKKTEEAKAVEQGSLFVDNKDSLASDVRLRRPNIASTRDEFDVSDGLVIGNEVEEEINISIQENKRGQEKEIHSAHNIINNETNNKLKEDRANTPKPAAESSKIDEAVVKAKKASAKKSAILPELKNPLTEKLEEKKRIPKNTRKLMDIELKENSVVSNEQLLTEKTKNYEISETKNASKAKNKTTSNPDKPINSDIGYFSEIDPILMNSEVIYDEKVLFSEVNESLKTMINEEVLITKGKTIIMNIANANDNDKNKTKEQNTNNKNEDSSKIIEKPKRESKRSTKKESSKSNKEDSDTLSSINAKETKTTEKNKAEIKIEEKTFDETAASSENIIKANDIHEAIRNIKFELNEEEKKKVFNDEIYNQEIEKETIHNIQNNQETILPEISFVENFHTASTQEKAIANNSRNRRNSDSYNKSSLFSPLKYTK